MKEYNNYNVIMKSKIMSANNSKLEDGVIP